MEPNIDITKLTRDFSCYPLQTKEQITCEDLTYLFIELNLTKGEVSEFLGCSVDKIYKFIKKYNLSKTTQQIAASQQNMNMRKYGVKNMMQIKEVADKCKSSYSKRTTEQRNNTRTKTKNTCLQRYGVDNVSKCDEIKQKKVATSISRYGVEYPNTTEQVKNKIKETTIKNNGGFPFQQHSNSHCKYKQTLSERYNTDNAMKNDEVKIKTSTTLKGMTDNLKQRNLNTIGVEWPSQLSETIDKICNTKRANKTFNSSKEEENAFCKLLLKFPDTLRQYKCDRYPFNCDFYIPCLDLFIELNYFWMHGSMPFDAENTVCRDKLEVWKTKAVTSKCYRNAIKTWAVRDVNKYNTANNNDLNYLRFYLPSEFDKWYELL